MIDNIAQFEQKKAESCDLALNLLSIQIGIASILGVLGLGGLGEVCRCGNLYAVNAGSANSFAWRNKLNDTVGADCCHANVRALVSNDKPIHRQGKSNR